MKYFKNNYSAQGKYEATFNKKIDHFKGHDQYEWLRKQANEALRWHTGDGLYTIQARHFIDTILIKPIYEIESWLDDKESNLILTPYERESQSKLVFRAYNNGKDLTPQQLEDLASEIRAFLTTYKAWEDTVFIFFSGKAYTNDKLKGPLCILKNQDPKNYIENLPFPHYLSMTFDGGYFYECFKNISDDAMLTEFGDLLKSFGLYAQKLNDGVLTCMPIKK